MNPAETKRRIAARVVTWRVGGVVLSTVIAWLFTGDPVVGVEIGVAYNLIRMITHMGHELVWSRWIRWGRNAAVADPEEAEPRPRG